MKKIPSYIVSNRKMSSVSALDSFWLIQVNFNVIYTNNSLDWDFFPGYTMSGLCRFYCNNISLFE